MAVTILQIAERLNLSHSTVSRVLNNKTDTYIAPATRRRVLAAAREMDYRPNLAARSLRDSQTNMVGLFASPRSGIWGGITPEIVLAASRKLHARHLDLFFAFSDEEDTQEHTPPIGLPAWRYDGAIVLQCPPVRTLEHLKASGQPFVAVNEIIAGGVSILCDDVQGTQLAMQYLWDLGHRRIAYAHLCDWHLPHYSATERHDTYLAFLREKQVLPVPGHDQVHSGDPTDMIAWLKRTVDTEKATAILAYDHIIGIDVLSAAHLSGIRVPNDLSLLCFNDDPVAARMAPPLSVVAPRASEMGERAADLLLERMDNRNKPEANGSMTLRIPEELIVRGSTTPPSERR